MDSLPFDQAHTPYIDAVAAELQAAGIELDSWGTEGDPPRSGYLQAWPIGAGIDQHPGGLCLLWDEETGWIAGQTTTPGGALTGITHLGDQVLPPPKTIAALTITRLALPDLHDQPVSGPRQYRSADHTSDGFAEQLAAYHPAHTQKP